jgi:hypothetical protein
MAQEALPLPQTTYPRSIEWLKRVILSLASVLVCLLLLEAMLHILGKGHLPESGWRARGHARYSKMISKLETNQLGFRGQQISYSDDDYVVVLLGDSQVEAQACAYEWMPERRLETYLNQVGRKAKVFSLGSAGYGQDQQLLALREYLQKYRADMVLLWLTPTNDVMDNEFPSAGQTNGPPKPTFWLENQQLRGPTEGLGQEMMEHSSFKLGAFWHRVFPIRRDDEWERHLPAPYTPMADYQETANNDWQERWDKNIADMRAENLKNEKSGLAIYLTPRSKRMQYGIDLTHKLLKEIEQLASSHGARFTIFERTVPESQSAPDQVHHLNGFYYKTSSRQFRENVNDIVAGFNYYLIPVTLEQHRVGPEDGHLNEHATDQVMKDLAEKLLKRN